MASMTSLASSTVSEKYSSLRKRLDNFGYRQPLGLESLQLVERLFSDLVHTTESLRKQKEEAGKLTQHRGNVEAHVEPFKQDNARLVRENNEIHMQLIKQKEHFEEQLKDLKTKMRKLEHENEDLRFLNDEYVHKLRQQEAESQSKSDRIAELQEKNVRAVVQTPGGRKKQIAFRRQRMEIDALLPDERGDAPTDRSTTVNQTLNRSRDADRLRGGVESTKREEKSKALAESERYKIDLLQLADKRIEDLTAQLDRARDEAEAIERRSRTFKEQVETREREIDRLHKMLDGGRPYDIVALESRNATNERLISHLNMQIDFLQTKNQELEQRVEEYEQSLKVERHQELEMDARNLSLKTELVEVDRLAKKLSQTKDSTIKAADLELGETRTELQRVHLEVERLNERIVTLEAERKRLHEDADVRRAEMQSSKGDSTRLEELCKRLQVDKNKLTQRVNKLTNNERELVLEIERLKQLKGSARLPPSKSPNRVDLYMRGVEQDRDYFKAECELLQKTLHDLQAHGSRLHSPLKTSAGRTRSKSPLKKAAKSAKPKTNAIAIADSGLDNDSERPAATLDSVDELRQQVSHYESTVRALENELNYYKRQVEQQQAQLAASRRARSPVRPTSPPTKERDDFEVQRLRKDLIESQEVIEKLERRLADVQTSSKTSLLDREKVSELYEESQKELKRLRQELLSQPKSPRVSLAAQAILRRVEAERDDTLAELRRTATERDSLKERLRVATETHSSERSRLEQRIEDLQETLRHAEHERDEQTSRAQALATTVQTLDEQRKSSVRTHAELTEELQETRANANQLRMLVDQAERALDDTKRRLASKDSEADEYLGKLRSDTDRLRTLEQTVAQSQSDAAHLRGQLANSERRAEQLQFTVETDREQIQKLDHELKTKEATLSDLRSRLAAHEAQLDRSNELVAARERDIKTLRKQFDAQLDENNELKKSRDMTMRENRRVQDDLATLARENQALQRELQDAIEERERFKQQVQDYVLEVKRVEDLLASKEQERTDLLEQYRMLSLEADKFQTHSHQLESDVSNYKLQLLTRESDARKFRERLEQAEAELHEHDKLQQQYEVQMSTLAKSISELEDLLRQSEAEKDDLLKDLQAVRDLCARLESSRDQLQRQLTGKSMEFDQAQAKMDAMLGEMQTLRDQVNLDRESIRSLETILQSSRDKEFQSHMNVQERGAELQSLRERCALGEAKLETMTREVSNLRARNLELEGEIEKFRRQLTSERFERERAVQEVRRYTPLGPALPAGPTSTSLASANAAYASGAYARPPTGTSGVGTLGSASLIGASAAAPPSDRLGIEQRTALLTRPLSAPKSPLRDTSSLLPGALSSTPTSSLTRQLLAGLPSREQNVLPPSSNSSARPEQLDSATSARIDASADAQDRESRHSRSGDEA